MLKYGRLVVIGLLFTIILIFSSCSEYRKVLKSSDIRLKYATAIELYNKGDYHRAMQLFDELMIYYRGTDTSEKINYYYSYCYFGEEDYLQAGFYFSKFVSTFPTSKYAEECMYMSAYCQYLYSPGHSLDQTITADAMQGLQLFINMYPKSKYVAKCNELLDELRAKLEKKAFETAKLYFKIQEYQAAVVAFKNLLKDFPDTRYREEAYFYMLAGNYYYAINSIETRKKERLEAARDAYNALVSAYPQTNYDKDAKSILKNIEKEIADLGNQDPVKHKKGQKHKS